MEAVQALLPQMARLAKLDVMPPSWEAFRLNVLVMVQLGLRRRYDTLCDGLHSSSNGTTPTSGSSSSSNDGLVVRACV